jgi:hypothetical protein
MVRPHGRCRGRISAQAFCGAVSKAGVSLRTLRSSPWPSGSRHTHWCGCRCE